MNNDYQTYTNQQLIDEFNRISEESGVSRSNINRFIKNHYTDLYIEIERRTIKLNAYKKPKTTGGKIRDISIFERLYCLQHNYDDRPLCKHCRQKAVSGFMAYENKYSEYCSWLCQIRSDDCKRKAKLTRIERYGIGNTTNAKKGHQTRIEKYGSHHPQDYPKKVKATKLKNYGDENFVNVDKIKQTVDRHKAENPNYYYDREQKTKQTKVANGHDPNWNNREKFKKTMSSFSADRKEQILEKRKKTNLETYGVEIITQSEEIKQKTRKTNLETYGVESILQLPQVREEASQTIRQKAWTTFNEHNYAIKPLISYNEFMDKDFNVDKTIVKWRCKKCGHEFEHVWRNWNRKCPKCFPQNFRGMQNEVAEFVQTLCPGHYVVRDNKRILDNARQLDIFVEDLNIAIEFNGCFWHNSDKPAYNGRVTPMMYHYNKSVECEKKGIRLIHIFEDEWVSHQKLCKSKLKKVFCPSTMLHIDANNCIVDYDVRQEMKEKLLNKYTFYGPNDGSSKCYALRYNGHVVAMLTLSRTRNNQKQYQWQIMNYIEVNSFIVNDGFDVLLKAFRRDVLPSNICIYAIFDWYTRSSYLKWMDFVRLENPRLYWTHNGYRIKGTTITPKNASEVLLKYDQAKTFKQNMNDNGYYRIYNSGTLVFSKEFDDWRV